jgi:hypothetical protein
MNMWSCISILAYTARRAQGNLYHILLPNYLFELTRLHNTLSTDIRRPSLSSAHAVLQTSDCTIQSNYMT